MAPKFRPKRGHKRLKVTLQEAFEYAVELEAGAYDPDTLTFRDEVILLLARELGMKKVKA